MTFAQFIGGSSSGVIGVINLVIVPGIFSLSFAVFIWGVANYFFFHGGNEEKRAEGREFVFWGIIGIVVLLSVWSFVRILLSTLGIAPGV